MVFDPATNYLSLNWVILLLFLIIIPKKFYFFLNRLNFLKIVFLLILKNDLKNNIKYNFQNNYIVFIIIFTFIYIINILRLIPFIFTVNRHVRITFCLSFPL